MTSTKDKKCSWIRRTWFNDDITEEFFRFGLVMLYSEHQQQQKEWKSHHKLPLPYIQSNSRTWYGPLLALHRREFFVNWSPEIPFRSWKGISGFSARRIVWSNHVHAFLSFITCVAYNESISFFRGHRKLDQFNSHAPTGKCMIPTIYWLHSAVIDTWLNPWIFSNHSNFPRIFLWKSTIHWISCFVWSGCSWRQTANTGFTGTSDTARTHL